MGLGLGGGGAAGAALAGAVDGGALLFMDGSGDAKSAADHVETRSAWGVCCQRARRGDC